MSGTSDALAVPQRKVRAFPPPIPCYPTRMSIDQITPAALKLPARERALLAASLWESLKDPFEHASECDDESALHLAEEREQEIESGRVMAVSHADMMKRLKK